MGKVARLPAEMVARDSAEQQGMLEPPGIQSCPSHYESCPSPPESFSPTPHESCPPPPYRLSLSLPALAPSPGRCEEVARKKRQRRARWTTWWTRGGACLLVLALAATSIVALGHGVEVRGSVAETSVRLEQIGASFLHQQEVLDDMEEQVAMLKTQVVVVEKGLAELKNISKDITAIQDIRRKVMEFADVFEEAANLSPWHPAVELISTTSQSDQLKVNCWTISILIMAVILRS